LSVRKSRDFCYIATRLDRLARSTRDLLNTLAAITAKDAGFRSLHDAWANTTTAHGRLMLTVLGGLARIGGCLGGAETIIQGGDALRGRFGLGVGTSPFPSLPIARRNWTRSVLRRKMSRKQEIWYAGIRTEALQEHTVKQKPTHLN